MATKFSEFTTGATTANTFVVGYDSVADTNNQYSLAQLAAGISSSIPTLYTTDSTIGTTRKALITDTIQFRNAGDTSDIFTLNTDGTFTLGLGAVSGGSNAVSIGNTANAVHNGIAIGHSASAAVGNTVSIGGFSTVAAGATQGVAIGYDVDLAAAAVNSIGLGSSVNASGANSVTFNASTGVVSPSTANACGVYMTSNTTPDFEVVGGGESTFNTSVKITGQAYTELHNTTNATLTVNWNDGNVQELTSLTGSLTFTASNPKAGATYILTLAQAGTVTPTWTGVKWPAGTDPTLSGDGKTDVITLICYDATGAGFYYGAATLDLA